jgi:hypothetical protein
MDTYLSVEAALELLRGLLPSSDPARAAFEALSAEDQAVYLRQAALALEGIRYAGRKTDAAQPLAFPRDGMTAVPDAVKRAQALEAVARCYTGAEAAKRAALQAQGVTSFSVGSLSESYGAAKAAPLLSSEALRLMSPYRLGAAPLV